MASQPQDRIARLRDRRVLVVDDDPDIRRMVSTVLEAAGARVDAAGSGADAGRKIAESAYDAILLDWHLDDMSATDFLAAAERVRSGVSKRIAVMTGDLIRGHETHDAERRGLVLLRKPFRPQDLIDVIERTLAA
jgi:DNA-binding response OmpR family regulator